MSFVYNLSLFVADKEPQRGNIEPVDIVHELRKADMAEAPPIIYAGRFEDDYDYSMALILVAHLATVSAGIMSLIGSEFGRRGAAGVIITATALFQIVLWIIYANVKWIEKCSKFIFFSRALLEVLELIGKSILFKSLPDYSGQTTLYWINLAASASGVIVSAGYGTISGMAMFNTALWIKRRFAKFPAWGFACFFVLGSLGFMTSPILYLIHG